MTGVSFSPIISERVLKRRDYPVFILLSMLSLFAIGIFLLHWFSYQDWLAYPVSFSLMTLSLLAILLNHQGRWFLLLSMSKPKPVAPSAGLKVAVVTTFVPGAEPLEMLGQTVQAW